MIPVYPDTTWRVGASHASQLIGLVYLIWGFISILGKPLKCVQSSQVEIKLHAYMHIHLIAALLFSSVLRFLAPFAVPDTVYGDAEFDSL